MPKLCKAGIQLREQVDDMYMDRDRKSDGWIGDTRHSARKSDHNPDKNGIVRALDLDADLGAHKEEAYALVEKILHGRWDIRETASKILLAMRDYKPLSVGIERGALKNAVLPYLSDLMRKNNTYAHIVDLTHGNRKKADRIIWSLQGRFEHGRIVLNSEEDWDEFVDQLILFPAQGVHDDLPDSLSYIDQLAVTSYMEEDDSEDWQPNPATRRSLFRSAPTFPATGCPQPG